MEFDQLRPVAYLRLGGVFRAARLQFIVLFWFKITHEENYYCYYQHHHVLCSEHVPSVFCIPDTLEH